MQYEINFYGRTAGALGVKESFTVMVDAVDETAAILKLYETHEHIHVTRVNGEPRNVRGEGAVRAHILARRQ